MARISHAKISMPKITGTFPRVRLYQSIDEHAASVPVVWVTGPPGAGKTTLVASYLENHGTKTLWYQVDEGDEDIATFFYYLGLAAKKATPRKRSQLPHLTKEYSRGIPTFTRNYFRKLCMRFSSEFAIVLDNYQEVSEEGELHQIIVNGLEQIPPEGHVFIMSRSYPPSAYARLRINGMLKIISWEQLKLDFEEASGILGLRGLSRFDVETLLAEIQGWVAGLILKLEQKCEDTERSIQNSEENTPQVLFEYFAGEIFNNMERSTQLFLAKSAFLPKMTLNMAEQITRNPDAEEILNGLHRKNYFTQKHVGDGNMYQYHPLFREFLLARSEELLSDIENTVVRWNAAELLINDGQIGEAVELLASIEDWKNLAELIKKHVNDLYEKGQDQTLVSWIDMLPPKEIDKEPWLLFWKGMCLMEQPERSNPLFVKSFNNFLNTDDSAGIYQAWARCVRSTQMMAISEVRSFDYWNNTLTRVMKKYPQFPNADIEAEVVMMLVCIIVWRIPEHPERTYWLKRAIELIPHISSYRFRFEYVVNLAFNNIILGENITSGQLVDEARIILKKQMKSGEDDYAISVMYYLETFYFGRTGNMRYALDACNKAIQFSEKCGIHIWDENIIAHGLTAALSMNDLATAKEIINRMESFGEQPMGYRAALYLYYKAWYFSLSGEITTARQVLETALDEAGKSGFHFFVSIVNFGLANVYFDMGEIDKVVIHLDKAVDITVKGCYMNQYFQQLVFYAMIKLELNENDKAREYLRQALRVGREMGYHYYGWWRNDVWEKVAPFALENDIESDYVKEIVIQHDISPKESAYRINNWPWRYHIQTFNCLEIFRENSKIHFGRKTPRKTIELIGALIAFGSEGVPEQKIIDALWPDTGEGTGHQNLQTAVHRLRKILDSNVIIYQDRKLSINKNYVWIDVLAFENILFVFDQKMTQGYSEETGLLAEKALSLYRGHFLVEHMDDFWSIPMREKSRNKFLRCVEKYGKILEQNDRLDKALHWYQKALDIDMFAEGFYQRLMCCYEQLDRKADAVETYRQCYRILTTNLGIEPSEKTKEIYTKIRSCIH